MSDALEEPFAWDEVGWDGHRRAQARRLGPQGLPEKLEWLEDAHKLALHLAASRRSAVKKGSGAARPAPER